MGSPRPFFSWRRGRVTGRRDGSDGISIWRSLDMVLLSGLLRGQDRVVDEARGTDAGGHGDEDVAVDPGDGAEVVGTHEGEVLGLDAEIGHRGAARALDGVRVALAGGDGGRRGVEGAAQGDRALA